MGGRAEGRGTAGTCVERAVLAHGGETCIDVRVDLVRKSMKISEISEGGMDQSLAICPRFLWKGRVGSQTVEAFGEEGA